MWRAARGRSLEAIRVVATSPIPHWEPPRRIESSHVAVPRGRRPVWWQRAAPSDTPVVDRDSLKPGHAIAGPAIVEGPSSRTVSS